MKFTLMTLFIVLVFFVLYFATQKSTFEDEDSFPKVIWLLWLQGWDKAPWLQQQVRKSWEKHNPGWEVRCIDEKNCPVKVDAYWAAAKSDVIRLRLLHELGGVWADSTMLCLEPLDNWYKDSVRPNGFWMYHGGEECKWPASWFMMSKPGAYIITEWRKACDAYWAEWNTLKKMDYGYFWMDRLFHNLHESDSKFREEWAKVPFECCEDEGSSHMFSEKVLGSHKHLRQRVEDDPPHAVKLDKACSDDPSLDNNCTHAVKHSLKNFDYT
jgi:hypothetical protein